MGKYKFNPFTKNFDYFETDHASLINIGTNTHAQIDTHIGLTKLNAHGNTADAALTFYNGADAIKSGAYVLGLTSGASATQNGFDFNKTTASTTGYHTTLKEAGTDFLKINPSYFELTTTAASNTIGANAKAFIYGTGNSVDASLIDLVIFGAGNIMTEQGQNFVSGGLNTVTATGSVILGDGNIVGASGSSDYSLYVIGNTQTVQTQAAVSIGVTNAMYGFESVMIGSNCTMSQNQSCVIGYSNNHGVLGGSGLYSFGTGNSGTSGICVGNAVQTTNAQAFACGLNLISAASRAIALGSGGSSVALRNTIGNSLVIGSGSSQASISFINNGVSFFNDVYGGFVNLVAVPSTPNLLVNPDFTGSAASWTLGTGWAYGTNNVTATAGVQSDLTQTITTEVGAYYYVSYVISSYTAGGITASFNTSSNSGHLRDANGTYIECFRANGTSEVLRLRKNSTAAFTLDTVKVQKIDTGSFSVMGTLYASDEIVFDGKNKTFGTTTGTKLGTATTEKLAFHNSTPVVQRAGAAQAAVSTTAATNIAPYGFTTAAQADAIVTLVNEIRAALVEKGLIKGSS